ncbi:MAG: hypothetical protein A2506_13140 [Elusimicrobia bacterium RIFOXYD12_FULL_66_9]|nr:MAG: hypothetical protein A2506_13140 [Elusimicrobia bacterium RIFOXYD12_FULL_66_9]
MRHLPRIFENNRAWAARREAGRWRRLSELNVVSQVRELSRLAILASARNEGHPVTVHGWIYDLHDGLLKDLDVSSGSAP